MVVLSLRLPTKPSLHTGLCSWLASPTYQPSSQTGRLRPKQLPCPRALGSMQLELADSAQGPQAPSTVSQGPTHLCFHTVSWREGNS